MKLAVIGSRVLKCIDIEKYMRADITEIVSGGAKGVDSLAREYAERKGIKLTEFIPEYKSYGRAAPIVRNRKIVDYADEVLAFWDGSSKGTLFVIEYAKKRGKPCSVILFR